MSSPVSRVGRTPLSGRDPLVARLVVAHTLVCRVRTPVDAVRGAGDRLPRASHPPVRPAEESHRRDACRARRRRHSFLPATPPEGDSQ